MDTGAPHVDWSLAARVAARTARPGPAAGRAELDDLVAELRASAVVAAEHVLRITELDPADPSLLARRVAVVDRATWSMANLTILAAVLGQNGPGPADRAAGRRGAGRAGAVQVGGVLGVLSSRVLGQFDPFAGQGLLLVAPNVLHHERLLSVDSRDFRLWVSLHEQTHAAQFAQAPWLSEHLRTMATELVGTLTDGEQELRPGRLLRAARAVLGSADGPDLLGVVLDAEQQGRLAEVTAVMALLEGHADVAMDAVGPRVVPSVAYIRRVFEARRDGAGRADTVLRRLLGLDAKLAQYRDGAAFVRAVTAAVGTAGLNVVWQEPAALPTAREISDPRAWVRRVHG